MTNDHLSDEGKGKKSKIIIICSVIQLIIAVLVIVFLVKDYQAPSEKNAFASLLKNTKNPDPETRLQSMDSLGKMLKDHPDTIDKEKLFMQMADVLSDEDPYVRYKAVTIFGYLGNPEAITCLKKALAQETDSRVRGKTEAVIKYLEMFENK